MAPSGRGQRERINATGAYVAGTLAGATALLTTALLVRSIGLTFPLLVVGLLAAAGALAPSQPHRISISRWRVPRAWGALGRLPYGLLFGFALGSGVLTATPSVGFIVLICWLLSTSTGAGVLVMLAFASARALPAVAIAADPRGLSERSRAVDRIAKLSEKWTGLERVVLVAFAVSALATSS